MKLTKSKLKQIIREELMNETGGGSGEGIQAWSSGEDAPVQSADHQSYADLASRLEHAASMLESITVEYTESGWLGDDKGMGNLIEDALHDVQRLAAYAQSATEREGDTSRKLEEVRAGKSYQIEGPEGDIVVAGDSHKFIDDYLGRVNLSKIIKEWMNTELRK